MGIGQKIRKGKCICRDDFLISHCDGKAVLHVGCTDYPFFQANFEEGHLLHQKIAKYSSKTIGIDLANEDVISMQNHGYDVRHVNAQSMADQLLPEKFDVILLADVIEHITNPGLVFVEAQKLLKENGSIIVTVPNAFGIIRFLKSFFRYEQVHPDHIAYYSSVTLETMAHRFDLAVADIAWYQFEARDKRLIVILSAYLERIFTYFFPWQGEGCIAVLKANTASQ
ncbi:MAG: methyltransferase domain-containing protein [Cyanobacteria bacterium P01_D01_bin.14]